jgi:hypothetical protein
MHLSSICSRWCPNAAAPARIEAARRPPLALTEAAAACYRAYPSCQNAVSRVRVQAPMSPLRSGPPAASCTIRGLPVCRLRCPAHLLPLVPVRGRAHIASEVLRARRLSHPFEVGTCHLRGRAQMPPLVPTEVVPECCLAYAYAAPCTCLRSRTFSIPRSCPSAASRVLRGRARMPPRVPVRGRARMPPPRSCADAASCTHLRLCAFATSEVVLECRLSCSPRSCQNAASYLCEVGARMPPPTSCADAASCNHLRSCTFVTSEVVPKSRLAHPSRSCLYPACEAMLTRHH